MIYPRRCHPHRYIYTSLYAMKLQYLLKSYVEICLCSKTDRYINQVCSFQCHLATVRSPQCLIDLIDAGRYTFKKSLGVCTYIYVYIRNIFFNWLSKIQVSKKRALHA